MVLYHHGIKDMHWGIRRFQNKDGSLTAEGIKRYRTDLNFKYKYDKYKAKQDAKAAEKAKQKEIKRVNKLMNKDTRKLTDAELEERIGRLAMEQKASDLEAAIISNKDQSKNKNKGNNGNYNDNQAKSNAVASFIKDTAKATLSATSAAIANRAANKIADKIFNGGGDKQKLQQLMQQPQQNQQQSQQQKPKWTDKDVSGDYSAGIIGSVNRGKAAVDNIVQKSTGKSVSDLLGHDDSYFTKSANTAWSDSSKIVSVSPKKSYDLYSWSSKAAETKVSDTYDSYSTTVGKSALNDIWGVAKSTPVSVSTSGINFGTDPLNYFTSIKPYSITTTKDHTMTGRLDGRAPTSTHMLNKMIDKKKR